MAKKLLHDYTFVPASNQIVINYIYKQERFLLITNVTDGITIYVFNDAVLKFSNVTYNYTAETTTLTLAYDCSGMSATDDLQIFVEEDFMRMEPSETFVDPVSKFRVSTPENLIDTDFEYGLQSTKWETLELVKNIPTFFSRTGDADLPISAISSVNGSDVITVEFSQDHGFLSGTPIIVSGTKNITCDGTFNVTNILTSSSIQYKAKAIQSFTGSILGDFTQLFPGSVYQGTEFDLTGISAITTDAESASTLTVSTTYPTAFTTGTSFYLTNSVGQINAFGDAANVQPENFTSVTKTVTNNVATGESGFSYGAVQPYDYTGTNVKYFRPSEITVDPTTNIESISFPSPHGFTDNQTWLYVAGEGNTQIGGLTSYTAYVVRVINDNAIYLTTTLGSTTRVNLTNGGADGGVHRSAFIRAYRATTANSSTEAVTFNEDHGILTNSNTPVLFFNGTLPTGLGTAATSLLSIIGSESTFIRYTRATTANTAVFSQTVNGAATNLTNTTANMVMVPVELLIDHNSIYFATHGLSDNDIVELTVLSGSAPSGLANSTSYSAEVVGPDRIRFKTNSTGAVINLSSIGTTTGQYRITSRTPILVNDSIASTNHGLSDGNLVVYSNGGNTDIPGLTNGTNYYVFQKTTNNFKLATTDAGWKTNEIIIPNQTSGINLSTDVITTSSSHGFTTGDAVQYLSTTPAGGLVNGAFYWVRSVSSTTVTLHWTKAGANANNERVVITPPSTGSASLRAANLVDITGTSTGTHKFSATSNTGSDGVYTISNVVNDTTFELTSNNQIPERELLLDNRLNLTISAFYYANHGFLTGSRVTYVTTGTSIGGLIDDSTTADYFIIRVSKDWFKLATTYENAIAGTAITLTSNGTGSHSISTTAISGQVAGPGTVAYDADLTKVTGTGTNFPAVFSPGDSITFFKPETTATKTVSSINTSTNVITTSPAHGLTTEAVVRVSAVSVPGGLMQDGIYYVRNITTTTLSLHPTPADATANTNIIDITTAGTTVTLLHTTDPGATTERTIQYVNGTGEIIVSTPFSETLTGQNYAISTALLIRADGFALHRPYDGGVELTPSSNPDSTMIRQTRKYFRYQSGKGIQVSFAVNFSPPVQIDDMFVASEDSGDLTVARVKTRYPHKLTAGVPIKILNTTILEGGTQWNGNYTVTSIVDPYTFKITLGSGAVETQALGSPEFQVTAWDNSLLKCGLFDDQNGLYFEYNGRALNVVRRSSVGQISGTVSVTFKSGEIVGTGTKFSSQLTAGDKIVIKGQTYLITKIASNTLMYILPTYRGTTATNVIVSKTVETKIPQSSFNIDKVDGTGPSGFYLDLNKIQMAYMDYSWYGAGKVRFGFKDQRGKVIYCHEFIHNNNFTEAYMRSGNLPARYEIENVGTPTYVPTLAHWGTSVIMDGRFDDDKAYVFTASSNNLSITGSASLTVSARVENTGTFQVFQNNQWRNAGNALTVATPSPSFNNIPTFSLVAGTGLPVGTRTRLPGDGAITPRQPYLASVQSRVINNPATQAARSLLLVDRVPTATAGSASNYTVTLSGAATPVVYEQPLISIRLAPSVDNGIPGALGQREIINRMQLILSSVGIISSHAAEIILKLNGALNNNEWKRVSNPSLSQLLYHSTNDTINGGTVINSFRATGGTGTTNRNLIVTTAELGDIATLGNSILGGDNTFPDGPDVLTVVARLVEDPSTVSTTNPFSIGARISWAESQA